MIRAACLVLALASASSAQQLWDARLTSVGGDVTVFIKGEDEGLPAKKDMPLEDGDRIKTGADSTAEISFEGKSVLSLRSNSDFTLESTRRSDSALSLALGSLLAKISGLEGGGLSVKTPTAITAVRGTEFAVEVPADSPDETHVGVFDEGKVEVKAEGGGAATLQANQETRVAKGQAPSSPAMLTRLSKFRDQVRGMRKRAQALRKGWKTLSAKERKARRGDFLARMREARKKLKDRKGRKEKVRKQEDAAKKANREKMEKRREEIKRRLHR